MKYILSIFLCLGVVAGSLGGGLVTEEEHQVMVQALKPIEIQCLEEFNLTYEGFEKIKESGFTEDFDPCLLRCFLQKMKFFDENSMLDYATTKTVFAKYIEDEERLNMFTTALEPCFKVNDEDLSAGKQGECERALLFSKCMMRDKKDLGLAF